MKIVNYFFSLLDKKPKFVYYICIPGIQKGMTDEVCFKILRKARRTIGCTDFFYSVGARYVYRIK